MATSLVVLSHGLWGVHGHMGFLEQEIRKEYKDNVHILNVDCNEAKYSYDGIDICGQRAANQIKKKLNELEKSVTKISFIGYSLGGLILRYAIGRLGKSGIFERYEPNYFITFATPHMGVKNPTEGIFSGVFNYISGRILSRTGDQLQLRDRFAQNGDPILCVLSDPNDIYFKYLDQFKHKRVYANIANDFSVHYWTAGIENMDYFQDQKKKLNVEMNEKYPSLLASFDLPLLENQSSVDITAGSPWRYAFIPAIPTILPLYLLLILSVLGIQGINSRRRVAAILSDPEKLITLQSEPPSAELLVNFLDVMNIPTEPEFHYTAIEPSKPLALESKPLPFNDATQRIYDNLSQVKWERFWVYIKSISAHGCIICREKRFYHDGGKATVQHFIDTTFLN